MTRLSLRIREELGDITIGLQRAQQAWQKYQESGDELYVDSVALNLQGVYTGLERLFEQIAKQIDNSRPDGTNWHELLLSQMAEELKGVRPAVISLSSWNLLDEYRRFRHVVRHIYAVNLKVDQVENLVTPADLVFSQVSAELTAFAQFLEQQSG